MRWTLRIIVLVALLWIGYAAWPFWAVYDFATAVERRDGGAVADRVNFPAVRQSLSEQIMLAYLQLTGKDARLGQFGRGIAVAAAASMADPIVAKFVSAEALIDLLRDDGGLALGLPDQATTSARLSSGSLGNVWQLFIHSEQGLRTFALDVPIGAPAPRRFRLLFRLTAWTWKLSAVELPAELRLRLARELVKQIDGK
jgi:hypothetical protein